jgi:hypothetical protein
LIIEVALAIKHPPFDSFVGIWGSVIADSLVALGVFGELLFSAMGSKRHGELQRRSKIMVAELNNDTARLRDALRGTVLSNRAIMTTTEVMAWTQGLVTSEKIGATGRPFLIIEKLAPFAGKQFNAIVTSSDIEQEALLNSLTVALETAGWIKVSAREQSGTDHTSVRGIRIDVDGSKDSTLLGAANTLASALNAEGLAATVNPKPEANAANANVIHILIGPKRE